MKTNIVSSDNIETTHTLCGIDILSNKSELHNIEEFQWKFTRYYFKNSFLVKCKYNSHKHIGILLSKDLYNSSFKAIYNVLTANQVLRIDNKRVESILATQ